MPKFFDCTLFGQGLYPVGSLIVPCLIAFATGWGHAGEVPEGFGQLKVAPVAIPGGIDAEGRKYSYLGQPAVNGKIILTASNGFFTKGTCKAGGTSSLPKVGDEKLIVPNFAYLDWKKAKGSIRWHIHLSEKGQVRFNGHLKVPAGLEGAKIRAKFADQEKEITTAKSNEDKAQPWDLTFDVSEPGEFQFSLEAIELAGKSVGHLHRIDVSGPAVEGAHLLRVRWRPAAVHGRYDTARMKNPRVLVFTTRSVCDIPSYSPITTPFGYYGTSFGGDRRSSGDFNFSMWGKKGAESDLRRMPHLLGVGSKDGEFSGFGHEGTGVKARGWVPMPDRPGICVQALRVVPEKFYDVFYGYYFDHPSDSWKFYCAGKKWHNGKPVRRLKLGSFCEVPGPPQSERTGDIYREVRRKAWAYNGGKWVPLEKYIIGTKGGDPVSKRWYTTSEGEYAMGCGGIRQYQFDKALVQPGGGEELPHFLENESIQRIFTMPIEYRQIQETEVSSHQALIEMDVSGDLRSGIIYYGTGDSLTFAPRALHGTEKNSAMSRAVNEQAWKEAVEIAQVKAGINQVTLSGLEPGTTYFYRVLINGEDSRVWSHDTLSFKTPTAGKDSIKKRPLVVESGRRS